MKKFIFCLPIFFIILACNQGDDNSVKNENEENILPVTSIKIRVELPSGTSFSEKDLRLSTFAESKDMLSNKELNINIYESEGYEIVFAEVEEEEIVLYGFINPAKNNELILNSESTALELIMTHPWCMNFNTRAKLETMIHIKELDVFKSFLVGVENGIKSKDLSSLKVDDIAKNG